MTTHPNVIWIENVPMNSFHAPKWEREPEHLRVPLRYKRWHLRDTPSSAVWLGPACCGHGDGPWSETDVWGRCADCGQESVPYVPTWDWERQQEVWRGHQ